MMRWQLLLCLAAACGDPGEPATVVDAGGDAASDAASQLSCTGAQPGAYCGSNQVEGGDADTLYDCPGPGAAPTSATVCAEGCVVEVQGVADHCRVESTYRLPWRAGTTMRLTQDCKDTCCGDHIADDGWAYDFANGGAFEVVAARGGTITHLKMNSTTGCGSSNCVGFANVIVIDHGDGTQATYLHFAGGTLAAGVTCGGTVERGQVLATAGTTGWSTGIHLHFQVGKVHEGAATCECGADGQGCAANTVPWGNFWSTPTHPTLPIEFEEWPQAGACGNRRIIMPASQNP